MAYTTTWSVSTYASADNVQFGHWYSQRNPKLDGMTIGTVMSIFRDKTGNWGTLDGTLTSRFPGWIECDGRTVDATEFPDLFDAIGAKYGGTATVSQTGNTKTYSGNFRLPNYHNRKLFGIGNVDGNSPSSPSIITYKGPDITQGASGDSTTVGSSGGNWFIKKIDAVGNPPDEQVYPGITEPDGQIVGFQLWQNEDIPTNGYVTKAIGEWVQRDEGGVQNYWNTVNDFQEADISVSGGSGTGFEVRIRAEAQYEDDGVTVGDSRFKVISVLNPGEGYTVGDTMGITFPSAAPGGGTISLTQFFRILTVTDEFTTNTEGKFFKLGSLTTTGIDGIGGQTEFNIVGNLSAAIGPLGGTPTIPAQHTHDVITATVDQIGVGYVAWATPAFYQIGTGEISSSTYSSIGYNTVVSPGGELNFTFNNYWAGDVQNNIPGLPSGGNASAGIGVNEVQGNMIVYNPGTLVTHTHYLQQTDFGDAENVYGYGNANGGGTAAGGMATNNTTTINFSQTDLAIAANEPSFELNLSKTVVPTPSLVPETTVPLLTKYHRVKYIIKAY